MQLAIDSVSNATRVKAASRVNPIFSYFLARNENLEASETADGHGLVESNQAPRDELWIHSAALPKILGVARRSPVSERGDFPSAMGMTRSPLEIGAREFSNQVRSLVKRSEPVEIRASIPLGIWQGEIQAVHIEDRRFSARLTPLRGSSIDMSGDISFDQVNPEDRSLIISGSVFYLEQYSRLVRRQVSYEQFVRFRRAPAWTKTMIKEIARQADAMAPALEEALRSVRYAE